MFLASGKIHEILNARLAALYAYLMKECGQQLWDIERRPIEELTEIANEISALNERASKE